MAIAGPSRWALGLLLVPLLGAPATAQFSILPPALPPLFGPLQLQQQVSCPALQQRVASLVGAEGPVWSITIADPQGRLLADLNG
ncbi:D-alanyl-D-alanine carboxypeptidase, partial [Cyanobium sp. HWJ4-Hawea]|nr:D-alanyl-D-alanine carboxypeptidase [Cyanobium sp. HWJ4-Hawea]